MAEPYSNLEVAATEHAEQSPEVLNHESFAPERDFSQDSPELDKKWPLQSPSLDGHAALTPSRPNYEKVDSHGAPEAGLSPPAQDDFPRTDDYKETAPEGASDIRQDNTPRRRPRIFWITIGFVVFLVIAIAVGVGVGVGVTRNKSSKSSSSFPAPAASSSTASISHGLYNDTSVAIVALGSGDKRLLFQENTGDIREALYTASTKTWTANVNNIVATNARNSTPLAALLVNSTGTPFAQDTGPVIFLFYIAENNVLASKQFISGSWTSRDNFSPNGSANATFPTAPDSRALAVTAYANSTVSGESFVFYVAKNGTVEALSILPDENDGITATAGPPLPASVQGGHVLTLAAGISTANGVSRPQVGVLTSNATVYYNLYFMFLSNSSWTDPELQTILVPPLPANEQITYPTTLTLANAYPASTAPLPSATNTLPPSSQSAAYNESLIGDVEIAQVFVNNANSNSYTLFGFWVNGTSLAAYTTKNIGLSTEPSSPFPFSRLAGTTVGNSSDIYLYHQVNGTALAEDLYNLDGGFFTTTYFDIATS